MSDIVQKCELSIGNLRIEILMQGGFSAQGGQSSVEKHRHPNFEAHYIEEGEYRFCCEDGDLSLTKDTLVIIPPKLYHSFHSVSESRKRLSFELRLTKQRSGADVFGRYDALFSSLSEARVIKSPIPELIAISDNMGIISGEEELCRLNAYFTLAFLKICDILRSGAQSVTADEGSRTAQVAPSDEELTVIKILDIITKKCRSRLTLGDVARSVGLSERQVQRILSARMGESFHAVLTKNRMIAAKELMSEEMSEQMTLEEIAYECGYSNYVSFWSQFKRATGKTPEQYRASLKKA